MGKGGRGSQANQKQTPLEQKKQKKDNKGKDIYVSIAFSIISLQQLAYMKVMSKGTKKEKNAITALGKEVEKSGSARKSYDYSIVVDCSDIGAPLKENMEEWREQLMGKLTSAVFDLKMFLISKRGKKTVHAYISATVGVHFLAYAMAFICGKDMTQKIKEKTLKQQIKSQYNKYFDSMLKKDDSSIKTDYYSIVNVVHAVLTLPQEKPKEKEVEKMVEEEEQVIVRQRPKLELLDDLNEAPKEYTPQNYHNDNTNGSTKKKTKLELL